MTVEVEPTITLGLGGGGETLFLCFGSCFLEDFDAALHTWMRAEMVYCTGRNGLQGEIYICEWRSEPLPWMHQLGCCEQCNQKHG